MKTRRVTNTVFFILILLLVGILSYSGIYGFNNVFGYQFKPFNETINKGLDLQGGVSVLEEIVSDNKVEEETIDRTIELISMRINPDGVSEISVTQEGQNRIRIEIPGKFDVKEVVDTVGKTGELTFRDPEGNVVLTGKDVKKATAYLNDLKQPTIGLEMNDSGTEKFAEATEKFLGKNIGIYMDEEQLTNPVVESIITQGKAIITGNRSLEEAKRIANIINSGALPVTLNTVSAKTVGATLGANTLPKSIYAGKIGIGLVFLFMILYYRVPGFLSSIALILYIILVLGIFTSINATLTLSGIAGFLLTVGMAVDANVLIFERIKEELKTGKSIISSVDAGFHRALSSILDSNITTIIAGIVLYTFGSGQVKGFALTLIIGIVTSILTALIVTKYLLRIAINMGLLSKVSHFGVKRG